MLKEIYNIKLKKVFMQQLLIIIFFLCDKRLIIIKSFILCIGSKFWNFIPLILFFFIKINFAYTFWNMYWWKM